jgi:transcription elongation GreA/GreB family factor
MKSIYVTEKDKERIERLMLFCDLFDEADQKNIRKLNYDISQGCIATADQIPPDVVTIHSRIVLKEIAGDTELAVTLVFPDEVDDRQDRISILSSLGAAIIGRRSGDIIEYGSRSGALRAFKIQKTSYSDKTIKQ